MSEIIASTFEVINKIGSGGGGVVYLANHLRLNKQVVLKADRRKISTPPELLRREVDVLKDLSHPYIPQVYDFFAEGEVVYTVMDYVDGESLDRPLKRGERFSQPQVIQWAIQLLQALEYLHSPTHGTPPRGYVHSDVKPANLMRRANGDICLIDFNISLALGEDSVIGASAGYASPEHYGLDYSFSGDTATMKQETQTMDDRTATMTMPGIRRKIRPDVRSDIYSTGATLYHLLSGRRPAKDALEVAPLSEMEVSPQIARMIAKAMAPNPQDRYQTASEMLWELEHLRENDIRTIRHKRRVKTTAAALAVTFLLGGLLTFTGLKQMERAQAAGKAAAEMAEQALSAVSGSESAYRNGDIPGAIRLAMDALTLESSPYEAPAQKALTDALGVYDLSDGFRPARTLLLPSAPLKAVLSPEGSRAAAMVSGKLLVFDTASGEKLAELPAEASALSEVVFAGEDRILYAGEGALRAYDLAAGRELWSGKAATGIALSADGSTAAAVYKDENMAAVYDAATGEVRQAVTFGERQQSVIANDVFADPEDGLFALSSTGRWLAVSFSDGSLEIFDLQDSAGDLSIFDASEYTHFEGGFYGPYLAFSAAGPEESVFAVIDAEAQVQTGGFASANPFRVQADEDGILVATENILVRLDPETGEQEELAYTEGDITGFAHHGGYTLTALSDSFGFYDEAAALVEQRDGLCDFTAIAGETALTADRNTPCLRILQMERHPEAQIFAYDRSYVHDEARISREGNVLLYRYDGFRLYAPDGGILKEEALPDPEQVYDQQFRREAGGEYLEVIYNNGTSLCYSATDGRLQEERAGTPPDGSLDEEFITDRLRITAPLHGTPKVYDLESGALVRTLEEDDYLAYAAQVDGGIMTEYITARGERYGLLLNEDCETLARLPGLCDVTEDGTLVFDDNRGNLRESRIYSLQELMAFAE
ncbi:MAG: protein kinase [Oscillibacter sp.]|jgi:hypothetical protein|nr:protein kinase [Oscillibacter sp.]